MNTIVLNPNDTIILKDTIVVKYAEVADKCLPILQESKTNSDDVWIVAIICGTVFLIAIIAAVMMTIRHNNEMKIRRIMEKEKAENDKKMKQYEAERKETEEWNRLARHFQKTVFDKFVAKKIDNVDITKEEDWKDLYKKFTDFINGFFTKINV